MSIDGVTYYTNPYPYTYYYPYYGTYPTLNDIKDAVRDVLEEVFDEDTLKAIKIAALEKKLAELKGE